MTDIHERLRRRWARMARAAKQPRSHYLIAGLAVAGLWLLNGDKSLLYHAVQMLIVMSVLTGLQIVLDRRHGKTPPTSASSSPNPGWAPWPAARDGRRAPGHPGPHPSSPPGR